MKNLDQLVHRILAHPSTHYEMNAAGYLERMELKLGGVIHVLSPHRGLHSEIGEMLYDLFNDAARQIEQHKDPSPTKCPNCNVYEIHPDSLMGWCKKCTGVLTGQKLPPMCMACGTRKADKRSEHDFCYKCHFDLTDELLDQPSGSREDEGQS